MQLKFILSLGFGILMTSHLSLVNAQVQHKFIEGKPFDFQPRTTNPANFNSHPTNRSYDGTNNNISATKKEWGATAIKLARQMPAAYDISDSKNAMNGVSRPSARAISNLVCDEPVTNFNSRGLSSFCYVWGQFLDHDITLTPTANTEYYPVVLPSNETVFTQEIPFTRSEIFPGTGSTSNREQTNLNTAWIDASTVYGSDVTRANWLRTFQHGKLKTSAGNYLPYNTTNGELGGSLDLTAPSMANDNNHTVKTFVAGDVRAAEHPGLLSLHTIFVREHNRICDRLVSEGWTNDELIYQRARKEVGAQIQVITYEEFLPAIGVTLSPYNNYKTTVCPDIQNIFATAGYRIGHTMVADDLLLRDDDCEEVAPGEFNLVDVFWTPQVIVTETMEPFLKGFASHTQYETDLKVNSILRNFLFTGPNDPVRFGIDLASLNIQRGRDHGLPSYSAVRAFYTGQTITSFSQITTNTTLAAQLQTLYGNVNNIDLWVGLLAEDRLPNKSVGKTMHAVLKSQFECLRDGDYYYYKNDPFLPSNIRNQIRQTSFKTVIQRNTNLVSLQNNVFFAEECPGDSGIDRIAVNNFHTSEFITAYPNPVSNEMTVTIHNTDQPCTLNLISTDGALIKSVQVAAGVKNVTMDMSELANGLYILNAISGNEIKTVSVSKTE